MIRVQSPLTLIPAVLIMGILEIFSNPIQEESMIDAKVEEYDYVLISK